MYKLTLYVGVIIAIFWFKQTIEFVSIVKAKIAVIVGASYRAF